MRKALDPPGTQDDIWIITQVANRLGADWGEVTPEAAWDELRTFSRCTAGMSWERLEELGGLQWPCPDEAHPGTQFLHARLWADDPAEQGAKAPFSVVDDDPPVDELDDDFPLRLTTGRRLDSYNTGVQTGGYTSPLRRGETIDVSPEDAERLGLTEGECVLVSSRRGSLEVPVHVDPALRPGLVFMTFHFPDEVDTNVLTIEATDPVRDRRVQGHGGADREAAGWRTAAGGALDLHLTTAAPTEEERAAVDALLGAPESGWHGAERDADTHRVARGGRAARDQRHLLLPALHALQGRVGWISEGGLNYVCERLDGPAGRGLRRGDVLRHVQGGAAAQDGGPRLRRHRLPGGGRRRRSATTSRPSTARGTPSPDGDGRGSASPVWHCASRAGGARPALGRRCAGRGYGRLAEAEVLGGGRALRRATATGEHGGVVRRRRRSRAATARLLRRVGVVDPTSFDDYHAHGGYLALRRAVELGPEGPSRRSPRRS